VTAEDVAGRLDAILATENAWIPASIGDEQRSVAEALRARGATS
jgi:hypothetical protein